MIDEKKFMEFMTALEDAGAEHVSFDDLRKFVDEFPKIGGWIPCSKNIPEWGTKQYLVCLKNGGIFMAIYSYSGEFKEICSLGIRDFAEENPVIAWKPLPEPYEVEENG